MSIVATCGHTLTEDEGIGVAVIYTSRYCDYERGFMPCEVSAVLCRDCVPLYRKWYPDLTEQTCPPPTTA